MIYHHFLLAQAFNASIPEVEADERNFRLWTKLSFKYAPNMHKALGLKPVFPNNINPAWWLSHTWNPILRSELQED